MKSLRSADLVQALLVNSVGYRF